MRRVTPFFILAALIGLCSCEFKVDVKQAEKPDELAKTTSGVISSKIRNGIDIKATGSLKVKQAFLLYEDGTLVPETNVTAVNQPVNIRLMVEGFTESDGKVEIGASEKIETNTGQVVLDEKDLFADLGAIEAERAKLLTLKATITRIDQLYDYFVVSFRIWDKKGEGSVMGSYRLQVQ